MPIKLAQTNQTCIIVPVAYVYVARDAYGLARSGRVLRPQCMLFHMHHVPLTKAWRAKRILNMLTPKHKKVFDLADKTGMYCWNSKHQSVQISSLKGRIKYSQYKCVIK